MANVPSLRTRVQIIVINTQLLSLAIAGLLTLMGSSFWDNLVYSLSIGNLASGLINLARLGIAQWQFQRPGPHPKQVNTQWPGWGWMLPVTVVGGALGYFGGIQFADWVIGVEPVRHLHDWRGWLTIFIVSTVASLSITWVFHARARIAATEAAHAAAARQVAETQLKLLESQLEPHMLFNTLANLRALIGVDPARAQAMLDRLIDFLRATLNASRRSMHPLRDEFGRLQDYLALMQIRMGDRLQVEFELPEDLAPCEVPALLLQPLVENAIKHGLEPQRGGGWLRLSAQRDGNQLLLQVSDTGLGLGAPSAPTTPGSGFGLTQVRERLHTLYGSQAGLALRAGEQGGTLAEVHLPCPITSSFHTTP